MEEQEDTPKTEQQKKDDRTKQVVSKISQALGSSQGKDLGIVVEAADSIGMTPDEVRGLVSNTRFIEEMQRRKIAAHEAAGVDISNDESGRGIFSTMDLFGKVASDLQVYQEKKTT